MKREGMKKGRELPEKLCTFCGGARVLFLIRQQLTKAGHVFVFLICM